MVEDYGRVANEISTPPNNKNVIIHFPLFAIHILFTQKIT